MTRASGKTASAAARKAAPRKPSARKGGPTRTPTAALAAGIEALSSAGGEAIARQSRVFETLLGIGRTKERETPNPLTAALDPFGFRKFEDVFDQRVARALANLGAPTAEEFASLAAEVERLRATVASLERQARKR